MKKLVSLIKRCLLFFPVFYTVFRKIRPFFIKSEAADYPRGGAAELRRITEVLTSSAWNMNYGKNLMHERLEREFSSYLQCEHAIAVNTGGVALQLIFRALGLKPGSEVIHQVDTCVATSYSVLNSFCVPVFSDIDPDTLMMNKDSVLQNISPNTRVVLPVHMWGNAENMDMVKHIASEKNLMIVEDSCLALGAEWHDRKVGTFGIASAFSFGCLKPVQAGEGGMIVTNDANLAKELRVLRDWGETTKEYGYRDQKQLSWNGRMSEFVAAIALAQLADYPESLDELRINVNRFSDFIEKIPGVKIIHRKNKSCYTQVVLKIEDGVFSMSKKDLMNKLKEKNIFAWHGNFEPLTTLSFFAKGEWKNWVFSEDKKFIERNYMSEYRNSMESYNNLTVGINKAHFTNKKSVNSLIKQLEDIFN